LLRYIDNHKDAVIPDFRQTELRNAVERISDNRQSGSDLCISRPKSRLDWGIELPFDKGFVTYVWFDALTNYISFAGYDPKIDNYEKQPTEFRDRWTKDTLQIIGKDILVPAHGIYWLIMLHAVGFPDDAMPQLLVHGWWNMSGAKMSKSASNVVDPFELADKYSAEAVRYYLVSDIATGKDAELSEERLIERYNSDLANNIGNLLNRTLNMAHRYRDGKIRRITKISPRPLASDDQYYEIAVEVVLPTGEVFKRGFVPQLDAENLVDEATTNADEFQISDWLQSAGYIATGSNQLVDFLAPWKLAKDPA